MKDGLKKSNVCETGKWTYAVLPLSVPHTHHPRHMGNPNLRIGVSARIPYRRIKKNPSLITDEISTAEAHIGLPSEPGHILVARIERNIIT